MTRRSSRRDDMAGRSPASKRLRRGSSGGAFGEPEGHGPTTLWQHVLETGADPQLLLRFIELHRLSSKIDPNRALTGVDIFRNFEYDFSLQALSRRIGNSDRVLDIGSSSTIWPAIIAERIGAVVHATDIDLEHLEIQRQYLANLGYEDEPGNRFHLERQDATRLTYEDASFSAVCSVSAIEHIPGDGDIAAVRESARVLRRGGCFIFTAPYATSFSEAVTEYYHHGYEKRYDLDAFHERIVSGSGLDLEELAFITARGDSGAVQEAWYDRELYRGLGRIAMFVSLELFAVADEARAAHGILAVLRKPG